MKSPARGRIAFIPAIEASNFLKFQQKQVVLYSYMTVIINFVLSIFEIGFAMFFGLVSIMYSGSSGHYAHMLVFMLAVLAFLMIIQAILNFTKANKNFKFLVNVSLIIFIIYFYLMYQELPFEMFIIIELISIINLLNTFIQNKNVNI
ncbi:hypothetical protein DY124_02370 [Apilactobacillus micheneri]|uniref:Uncharacterized protein n=1 Tax=Apilactobacillus micheneri TaxID=1899430 RepID=A0A9Q8IMD7_9LACO|nr:hypothetical protein [Apilactobacillus micheneri]TPR40638.1 hypothetical protein DY121_02390 [Apilactobacillus micheneri]TPR44760.1 hypothetical protein DY124_02370 [Apilactobacillus micheneri]TPR45059.1 hypothetical protein DY130_02385 [Apilactobacillus micheneri]TPR46401.1 hypothetical protein DY128_02385 [Apilactobacillus micheneri]TPR48316.1 hypothetical protein DY125_02370 [Apilactobacillus micheneri]